MGVSFEPWEYSTASLSTVCGAKNIPMSKKREDLKSLAKQLTTIESIVYKIYVSSPFLYRNEGSK